MSKLINLSINVSKIDKSRLIKGAKGTYLNLTVAVNDEKDQYDNDVSAWEGQTKEERDAKTNRNFLGNGRVVWSDNGNQQRPSQQQQHGGGYNQQGGDPAFEQNSGIPF